MNNGSGLRVVLWLSGCDHKCKGCQNFQTWDANSGILFDKEAEEELLRELGKDYISGLTLTGGDPLHENNLDGVLNLVNRIRLLLPEKTIWLYTGYKFIVDYPKSHIKGKVVFNIIPNVLSQSILSNDDFYKQCGNDRKRLEIISRCNVLVDGRYIDSQRDITLKWRGSRNQRVIDIKKSLEKGEVVLWDTL